MTPEHLARQVERLCERWPDTRVVGVHAARWQGGDSIAVDGHTFPIHWCPSALALSERLAALGENDRLIVLTPLVDTDLSLDVRARLARYRLLHPERWQLVRDAYGVAGVDPRLPMKPWMADALLGARPHRASSRTSVLDADTAWTHVLNHHLGLPDGTPDAGTIIRWSMDPRAAVRFAALPEPLAEAVGQRLGETAGGLGALLAGGIASGHAGELLPIGLVCDVLFSDEGDTLTPGLVQAAARLEPLLGGASVEPARGREWTTAARRVLRALPRDQRGEWLGRAEVTLSNLKARRSRSEARRCRPGFKVASSDSPRQRRQRSRPRTHSKRPNTHSAASRSTPPATVRANAWATSKWPCGSCAASIERAKRRALRLA